MATEEDAAPVQGTEPTGGERHERPSSAEDARRIEWTSAAAISVTRVARDRFLRAEARNRVSRAEARVASLSQQLLWSKKELREAREYLDGLPKEGLEEGDRAEAPPLEGGGGGGAPDGGSNRANAVTEVGDDADSREGQSERHDPAEQGEERVTSEEMHAAARARVAAGYCHPVLDPDAANATKNARVWKKCSVIGCANISKRNGVCVRHGARPKLCSRDGCTNDARRGGLCQRHGGKSKMCSREGCTTAARKAGLCQKHGGYCVGRQKRKR